MSDTRAESMELQRQWDSESSLREHTEKILNSAFLTGRNYERLINQDYTPLEPQQFLEASVDALIQAVEADRKVNNEWRTCGICDIASIQRGVEWAWWEDGKPVHPFCMRDEKIIGHNAIWPE